MPNNKTIESLHAAYTRLTGYVLQLDMAREYEWFQWQRRGFTEQDLALVINYIKRGIREGRRNQGALKFSNLIVSSDFFEEDLAEAKALARMPKPNPHKQEVLRATGRIEQPSQSARSAAEVIKTSVYQELVALRKSLEPLTKG